MKDEPTKEQAVELKPSDYQPSKAELEVLPPSSVATPYLNANVSWPARVGERH